MQAHHPDGGTHRSETDMGASSSKATVYPENVTVKSDGATDGRGQIGPKFSKHLGHYGGKMFSGVVAKKYLMAAGLPVGLQDKVFDDRALLNAHKDTIAKAVVQWAKDNEATMYSHWFQPLGSEIVRQGCTGQVKNMHTASFSNRKCRTRIGKRVVVTPLHALFVLHATSLDS